jgi:hypothetical protein
VNSAIFDSLNLAVKGSLHQTRSQVSLPWAG